MRSKRGLTPSPPRYSEQCQFSPASGLSLQDKESFVGAYRPYSRYHYFMAPAKIPKEWGLKKKDLARFNFLTSERPFLNEENFYRIQREESGFSVGLEMIRHDFGIPDKLKASSDGYSHWVPVGEGDVDLIESRWMDELNPEKKRKLEKAIELLLSDHKLPIDFYDIAQYWLLYRKMPKGIPPFGIEHIFQIIEKPTEAWRLPLNTAEKKLLTIEFRDRLGIKSGRVPKKYALVYKQFLDLLSSSKNKTRRLRSLKTALAALDLKGQRFADNRVNEKQDVEVVIESRKTYLDLVGELFPIYDVDKLPPIENDKKVADTIRHHKMRFLRRGKKDDKKVEK